MVMKIIQKHVHLEGRTRCAASPKIVCGLALREQTREGENCRFLLVLSLSV